MIARRMFDFPTVDWHNPFAELERMSRQMDILTNTVFGRPTLRWFHSRVFPAVNITEDKEKYYIRAELPGMGADEIDLSVTGNDLSIAGERRIRPEDENAKYHRRERQGGKFSKVVSLPGEIDADSVEAKMVNGVLTVAIVKAEASKPRQITVQ